MIRKKVFESVPRTFQQHQTIFRSPENPPGNAGRVLLIVDGYYAIGFYSPEQRAWAIENGESYPDQTIEYWAELPPIPC